jgi:hypothetical protein
MAIASSARPRGTDAKTRRLVYGWISDDAYEAFERAAAARGEHVAVIVARTLQLIGRAEVIDAILDDPRDRLR